MNHLLWDFLSISQLELGFGLKKFGNGINTPAPTTTPTPNTRPHPLPTSPFITLDTVMGLICDDL
jgi:hypothetical protein